MNSPLQASLFEPEGEEAVKLLRSYLRQADAHASQADTFDLLQMPGAAARAESLADQAAYAAFIFAMLLDFEREAGL